MSENIPTGGSEELRSALHSVGDAQSALAKAVRPPLWLTALLTSILAAYLLSAFLLWESPFKAALIGILALGLVTCWLTYYLALIRKGLRLRIMPVTTAGRWLAIGQVVLVVFLSLLTGWARNHGYGWSPWAFTVFVCVTFAALLHFFPSRVYAIRTSRNRK